MKLLYVAAASTLALSLGACGSGPPKTRAALDCPATEGRLTRTATAPDGKACQYVAPDGAEVSLQLMPVSGGPDATLRAVEATLLAGAGSAEAADVKAGSTREKALAQAAPAAAGAAKDAAAAEREAREDAAGSTSGVDFDVDVDVDVDKGSDETVKVTAGHGVVVDEGRGRTRVNLPGIHIDADDRNDSATVQVGPINIQAGDEGATIRIRRDVRLKGEHLSREKRGIRATFIAEREGLPNGYSFVAYEAGGPKVGPLTVATVKGRQDLDDEKLKRDIQRLVRRNGGV